MTDFAAYFAIPILSFVFIDPETSKTRIKFFLPAVAFTYHGLYLGS